MATGYNLMKSTAVLETYLSIINGENTFQKLLRKNENKGSLAERLKLLFDANLPDKNGIITKTELEKDKRVKFYSFSETGAKKHFDKTVELLLKKNKIEKTKTGKLLSNSVFNAFFMEYLKANSKQGIMHDDLSLFYLSLMKDFSNDVNNTVLKSLLVDERGKTGKWIFPSFWKEYESQLNKKELVSKEFRELSDLGSLFSKIVFNEPVFTPAFFRNNR